MFKTYIGVTPHIVVKSTVKAGVSLSSGISERLNVYEKQSLISLTKEKRINSSIYLDLNGEESRRATVEDLKNLNTKIVSVDSVEDVDFESLSVGDFVFIKA